MAKESTLKPSFSKLNLNTLITMEPELKNLLFAIIRSGMEISDLDLHISEEELLKLCVIAKAHSILPILVRGINRSSVQGIKIPQVYEEQFFKDTRRSVLYENTIKKIKVLFKDYKIPFILLKGSILRELYPDVLMRTSCDLDILIHENDMTKAISVIESGTGFKIYARGYHDVAMIDSDLKLELHFSLKENMTQIDSLLNRVWEFSIPNEFNYQYTMSLEYQIFYILAHMSYHLTHGGIGIRPLLDLWLLNHKTTYDKTKLNELIVDAGISVFYEKCSRLTDAWMSNSTLEPDLLEFEEFCLSGGVFGDIEKAALSQVRNNSKVKYVYNRLFVSRKYLEELYPKLKTKPYLLPLYQIKRWFRLNDRHRRIKAQKEFEVAISSTQKDKEKIDLLLKSLGF